MITDEFIASFSNPIPKDMMLRLNAYMTSLDPSKAKLVASCAKYLENNNNIQALLHVQYALNEQEVLLRSPNDENNDIEKEMQKLLYDDEKST